MSEISKNLFLDKLAARIDPEIARTLLKGRRGEDAKVLYKLLQSRVAGSTAATRAAEVMSKMVAPKGGYLTAEQAGKVLHPRNAVSTLELLGATAVPGTDAWAKELKRIVKNNVGSTARTKNWKRGLADLETLLKSKSQHNILQNNTLAPTLDELSVRVPKEQALANMWRGSNYISKYNVADYLNKPGILNPLAGPIGKLPG